MSDEFRVFGYYPIKKELLKEYVDLTILELLERYRESVYIFVDDDGMLNVDSKKEHRADAENIPRFLSSILGLPQIEDVDWALGNAEMWLKENVGQDIEDLDHRSKTHRHKTLFGVYTEKPSFTKRR